MKKILAMLLVGMMLVSGFYSITNGRHSNAASVSEIPTDSVMKTRYTGDRALVPTWYDNDWWAYSRDWNITLGNMGYVSLTDRSVYTVNGHETFTDANGTYDVYNLTVMTTSDYGEPISGGGKIYVESINTWIPFTINPSASSGSGFMLVKRSDLSMVKMFMYLHINAQVEGYTIAANLDLNVTLDPQPMEEDYDFPIEVGEEWHQNWTINAYGNYHLEAPVSGYEDYGDKFFSTIQMDSDYTCTDTVMVTDPNGGGQVKAFFIDSTGTDLSDTPGGKQIWKYTPTYRWFHEWTMSQISLGDMGGAEGMINYIKTVILRYGSGYSTSFQGTLEDDPELCTSYPGGEITVYASDPATVSIAEAGISVDTTDMGGRQGAVLTLPDASVGDTTPCPTDNGSFGIIIQSKNSPDDYVVRCIQLRDPELSVSSLKADKTGLLLQGENLTFSYTFYNEGDAFIGTPFRVTLAVDDTVVSEKTYTGVYGAGPSGATEVTGQLYWIADGGHHTLTLTVDADNAIPEIHENNNVATLDVDVDSAPTGDFDMSATTAFTGEEINFTARDVTDPDGDTPTVSWDFDGDGTVDATGDAVTHAFTDGSPQADGGKAYNVTMVLTDDKGATARYSKEIRIYNRAPTVSLTVSFDVNGNHVDYTDFTDTIYVPPEVEVTFSAQGSEDPDGEIIQYKWDLGGTNPGVDQVVTYEWYEETDTMQCSLSAIDDDHEESQAITFTMKVANVPPQITASADKTSVMTGEQITFTATVEDLDGSVKQVWWDFDMDTDSDGDGIKDNDYDSMDYTATHAYAKGAEGGKVYRVKVSAKDDGMAVSEKVLEIKVFNRGPVAVLADVDTAYAGSEYTFDATGSYDPEDDLNGNGEIDGDETSTIQYRIVFGDGSDSGWGSDPIIKYTYTEAGTYNGSLEVKDSDGNISTVEFTITVKAVNHNPTLSVTITPESVTEGGQVTVQITASDEDGQELEFNVDFGDGSTTGWQKNSTYTHTYENAGDVTVTVTARDGAGGTATWTGTVSVKSAGEGDEKKASSSSNTLPIIIILVVLIAAAAGGFFYMKSKKGGQPPTDGQDGQASGGATQAVQQPYQQGQYQPQQPGNPPYGQ